MDKKAKVVIVFVIVALVIATIVIVTRSSSDSPSSSNTNSSTSSAVATNSVAIKDYAFAPAAIKVKVGTKVTWTNQDTVKHTVTSADSSSLKFESKLLAQGESYSYTFTEVGTFSYFCLPHPYMKATVTVTQ